MTTTLYRPVNPAELALVKALDFKGFPPRLSTQPIFYPVLSESYAKAIGKWNIAAYGASYILKFDISTAFLDNYYPHIVGSKEHKEYWIPSEDLSEFNKHIIGLITII